MKNKEGVVVLAHPEDIAVQMLDYEADKDLPDRAHASALFFRLMSPMYGEACEKVAIKYGSAMLLESVASWLGSLAAGILVPQVREAPLPVFEEAMVLMSEQFQAAALRSVQEFVKTRDGEGGKQ